MFLNFHDVGETKIYFFNKIQGLNYAYIVWRLKTTFMKIYQLIPTVDFKTCHGRKKMILKVSQTGNKNRKVIL